MAKPAAIQKLQHGKALCGATFGGFVDTFNWLVDFCTGLRGDGDNNGSGTLTLDRTMDAAPTIRTLESENGGDGGGGGDGDEQEPEPEPEPGSQQDEPYQDPEDYPYGPDWDLNVQGEAYSADGNEISEDVGSEDIGAGNFCNSISGWGGDGHGYWGGNEISYTCS